MENQALSWTDESRVVWQRVGEECIRDKNDKSPSNCGQIAKEYLLNKEKNTGFRFTFRGKDAPKPQRIRRQKKRLLLSVSGPADHSAEKAKLALE